MRRLVLAAACALLAGCGGREEFDDTPIALPAGIEGADPGELRRPLGAAIAARYAREDEAYLRRFAEHYTFLTPEKDMFWAIVQPERGEWDFVRLDLVMDLARRLDMPVRGVLIWDQVIPGWISNTDWEPDELRAVYVEHIRTLVRRYRDQVTSWVVINEPLTDEGGLEASVWARVLGADYIRLAFEVAREEDPDAELLINEIAAERGGKLDAYVRLVSGLRERGVPVDGVGLQNHTTAAGFPTRAELEAAMRRFTDLGLDVHITEMDVTIPRDGGQAALRRQAAAYRAAAEACAAVERCRTFVTWGVTDRWSWKGEELRPLPFDSAGRPKPAFEAMMAPLRRGGGRG
jgi:endo-1,4-beta-xylanase